MNSVAPRDAPSSNAKIVTTMTIAAEPIGAHAHESNCSSRSIGVALGG